jgi:hypothetical protein
LDGEVRKEQRRQPFYPALPAFLLLSFHRIPLQKNNRAK